MKRLMIDDMRSFARTMSEDVAYARSSGAGIKAIRDDGPWDEVWFDHDLGGEDTIYPVVLWLLENAFYGQIAPIGECVIITANPVGRQMLEESLRKYWKVRHEYDENGSVRV